MPLPSTCGARNHRTPDILHRQPTNSNRRLWTCAQDFEFVRRLDKILVLSKRTTVLGMAAAIEPIGLFGIDHLRCNIQVES